MGVNLHTTSVHLSAAEILQYSAVEQHHSMHNFSDHFTLPHIANKQSAFNGILGIEVYDILFSPIIRL